MPSELDGTYRIVTVSSYGGPIEQKSDGVTEIRDGRTQRRDANNVLWTSTFEVVSPDQVKMTSVADPADAAGDFALLRPDGAPTRAPVTYETLLRYARKGDKVQLSGQIEYGKDIIILTMRSIGT
jgi:hypothetical protein